MDTDRAETSEQVWAETAIRQNRRWLLAYLLTATGRHHVAEDLVQEVFVIAHEKRADFNPEYPLGAWLRGIARNVLRRYFREAGKQSGVVSWDALEGLETDAQELEQEDMNLDRVEMFREAIQACLQKLSGRARTFVELHYGERCSLRDLAARHGLTVSNVGVLLYRARQAMRQCITKRVEAEGYVTS